MIPTVVLSDDTTGEPAFEVYAAVQSELPNSFYAAAWVTVRQPVTGKWATARAVTYEGISWVTEPGTFSEGYAGFRDAQRKMFELAGLDNHGTVTSAEGMPTSHRPNGYRPGKQHCDDIVSAMQAWVATPDNTPEELAAWQEFYNLAVPEPPGSVDITEAVNQPVPVILP